ncbi:hypothetical protein APL35_gp090 [Apis mellifera filamentous virus]|uniref:hypothetical protein n=1 Tax=Apis mellifera filamentous virus TaxID=1100043 RepID=UPI0006BCADEF|nr:hypothetical protein APL35_gp090 [Apis mellifera filamentous virus]
MTKTKCCAAILVSQITKQWIESPHIIPSYRSLLMVVSDFLAAFQLDNLGLEIGLRESHLHDNFRKKSSVFFRSMNSSSSSWTRELYRQFFSSFYQDTKRLPRSDVFRGPLVEYI